MTKMVVYYDSHPGGLGLMNIEVPEGDSVYEHFHGEAKHRKIECPSFLAAETMDQALHAKSGMRHAGRVDFIQQRVRSLPRVVLGIDAGAPKDECVMVSRDANGDIHDAIRMCFEGADYQRKTEKLRGMAHAFGGIRPTETPFMESARRAGKTSRIAAMFDWFKGNPQRLFPNNVQGVWIHDEFVEHPTSDATPKGLLCVSSMDGRLGNRWMP